MFGNDDKPILRSHKEALTDTRSVWKLFGWNTNLADTLLLQPIHVVFGNSLYSFFNSSKSILQPIHVVFGNSFLIGLLYKSASLQPIHVVFGNGLNITDKGKSKLLQPIHVVFGFSDVCLFLKIFSFSSIKSICHFL